MKKPLVSVIIPNWNGEKLLRKNLPKILTAVPKSTEVIVIDNGSMDGSVQYINELAGYGLRPACRPVCRQGRRGRVKRKEKRNSQHGTRDRITIKLVKNKKNLGFIKACSQGVKIAKGEFIVLLNNDVIPEKNFLKPALVHFKDKNVFAVSFNENKFGWAKIWWRVGFIHHGVGGAGDKSHLSAWANGGSAVFRKSMWKELEGFDELYEPFYWEDFDLGYRAWANGWKIIWEPAAKVVHKHEATISKLDKYFVGQIKERNQLLFIWKNITDPWLKFTHLFGLLFRVLMGPNYLKVVFSALKQYSHFGKPKNKNQKLSDKEILNMFK